MSTLNIEKPAVSVIICAYTEERWHDIIDAIASVRRQSIPSFEIVLVVDHNVQLLERVRKHLTDVVVAENSEPQGLSGARNSGLKVAQGTLIAFLDDDAIAEPDWLEHLLICCNDPQVLGAGGTVEPEWLCEQPRWFPEEFYWVVGCSYQARPTKTVVVRNPYGGCTCIRREVFDAVGGFRSGIGRIGKLPMGCEETELSIRATQHWPHKFFLYEPRSVIHHRIAPARANWRYFFSRCYAEGLSKAIISQFVGSKDALASERTYTLKTLPLGVIRNIFQGMLHFDITAFQRAGAIIVGLVITTSGYLVGVASLRSVAKKRLI
jgi:GT2 family glycosyltransferase